MDDLLARLRRLYSAVVSDVLDGHGLRHQTLNPGLLSLGAPTAMVGRAATLEVVAVDAVPDEPYKVQFEAVDALSDDCVMVVSAPSVASASWGELLTTR